MSIKAHLHNHPIIFLVSLSLLFCPYFILTSSAFGLSVEDENILGEKFLTEVRKYFEVIEDDFANQFISDLGQYLIKPLETKRFPFHFYIIKNNSLNAFAAPGGHVFVFSGLLEVTESIDELAAVICHEVGHVSAMHLARRLEQSKKIGLATMAGILAGVLIGGPVAEALVTGSMAVGMQAQLHYSRNDERQADQLGFRYMKSAGFDPRGMITILKKIEKGSWLGTDKIPAYLLTHPTGPERMANFDTLLSGYIHETSKRETNQFRASFPYFATVIRAKCLDSREAERLFNIELKKHPDSSLPHLGLGIVYKERSEYSLAISHLKKALDGNPRSVPILANLSEAYQENGQSKEAISMLEEILKMGVEDRSTLFLLGLSYENLEQYDKAISLFERLASFKPVKNEVYYHLGLSYGRQDRLGQAHYNFGLYFKSLGQAEKAEFHFQKADAFSNNNPALRRKIEKARKGVF